MTCPMVCSFSPRSGFLVSTSEANRSHRIVMMRHGRSTPRSQPGTRCQDALRPSLQGRSRAMTASTRRCSLSSTRSPGLSKTLLTWVHGLDVHVLRQQQQADRFAGRRSAGLSAGRQHVRRPRPGRCGRRRSARPGRRGLRLRPAALRGLVPGAPRRGHAPQRRLGTAANVAIASTRSTSPSAASTSSTPPDPV